MVEERVVLVVVRMREVRRRAEAVVAGVVGGVAGVLEGGLRGACGLRRGVGDVERPCGAVRGHRACGLGVERCRHGYGCADVDVHGGERRRHVGLCSAVVK